MKKSNKHIKDEEEENTGEDDDQEENDDDDDESEEDDSLIDDRTEGSEINVDDLEFPDGVPNPFDPISQEESDSDDEV